MTNNSSDLEILINQATQILGNTTGFVALLTLEAIIAIASVLPNALLLYVLFWSTIFPSNLRLLLGHLSLNLVWYAVASSFKSIDTLIVLIHDPDPADLVINAYLCKSGELANTIPIQNTVYTSLALCLERLYSTVWYKRYEKQHSKPYLACIFIPVVWAVSLANQLNSLFTINRLDNLAMCESLISTKPSAAMLILILNLTSETACVLLIVCVYLRNKNKLEDMTINRAKQPTLGARFMIIQNVQVNSMMMPSMILQSLCYLPNYVFLLFVIFSLDVGMSSKVILIHCNYLWKLFYAFLHPVVAFMSKAKLGAHLKKHSSAIRICTGALKKVKPIKWGGEGQAKVDEANNHFDILNEIWNVQANQIRKVKMPK